MPITTRYIILSKNYNIIILIRAVECVLNFSTTIMHDATVSWNTGGVGR